MAALPGRGEFVVRNAHVLTMDPSLGDLDRAIELVKEKESQGYQYEGAEASFELLVRRSLPGYRQPWELEDFVIVERRRQAHDRQEHSEMLAEAMVKLRVDGELLPTLENRKTLTRLIREWKADLVISPRPNDYHPDHRYTGILVQDAAFMVIVPNFCPDVPALRKNPVFVYGHDAFQRPNPFRPDVAVAIDVMRAVRLRHDGYRIWTQNIPAAITPKNRLLLGAPEVA